MSNSVMSIIRSNRFLYTRLKALKYKIWQTPAIGKIVTDPIELPQMEAIGQNSAPEDLIGPGGGPKILFFTFRAWSIQVAWDTVIAAALRLRGVDVHFFTCGKRVPLCDIVSYQSSPPTPCDFCATYTNRALNAWQFPVKYLRDFITSEEISAIRRQVAATPYEEYQHFKAEGLPVGELVTTSVRWFLSSGTIGTDKLSRETYRKFLISGAMMARVGKRLLDTIQPDKLYLLSGLFFAERIMFELAKERNLPVVTHEVGFMPNTLIFAHNGIASYFELDESWEQYKTIPLKPDETKQLDDYIVGRRSGGKDVAIYYPSIQRDEQAVITRLNLDPNKKIVLALTNILWDSAVLDRDRVFDNMTEWLAETVRYCFSREDIQLIIRIHPAEIRLPMHETREKVTTFLSERFSDLPDHIKIIPPESDISSYTLMGLSCAGLVYTSTTGLEMSLMGKPVIVSGKTHYLGKGFTIDPENRADYLNILGNINTIEPLTQNEIDYARRYAYLFFFRFMLPFPAVTTLPRARLHFNFETLAKLRPGRQPELDFICDALLNNTPFIRPTGIEQD